MHESRSAMESLVDRRYYCSSVYPLLFVGRAVCVSKWL